MDCNAVKGRLDYITKLVKQAKDATDNGDSAQLLDELTWIEYSITAIRREVRS